MNKTVKRLAVMAPLALGLAACDTVGLDDVSSLWGDQGTTETRARAFQGAGGHVAGDEPQAVQAMRRAIEEGGSAADAMLSGFFTMVLTYPVAVSPASGGACMVYEGQTEDTPNAGEATVRYLSFPVTRPAKGGNIGVPGAVRGLWALHLDYGNLRWSRGVLPRLTEATRGVKMTRALRNRVEPFRDVIAGRPALKALVAGPDGEIANIGQTLRNPSVVPLISALGQKGPAALYSGALAIQYVNDANDMGGNISTDDLKNYQPVWSDPVMYKDGDVTWAWSDNTGGREAGQLVAALSGKAGSADTDLDVLHLVTEASHFLRTPAAQSATEFDDFADGFDDFYNAGEHKSVPAQNPVRVSIDGGTVGLVASDNTGMTVSCAFGLNGPFGAGQVAPGLGAMLPAAPRDGAEDSIDQVALGISTWGLRKRLLTAVVGTGGLAASEAVATTLLAGEMRDEPAKTGLEAPRSINPGNPDGIFVEDDVAEDTVSALANKGHNIRKIPVRIGRVQIHDCRYSLIRDNPVCRPQADPRSSGLAQSF